LIRRILYVTNQPEIADTIAPESHLIACKCLSKITGIGSLQKAFLKKPQNTFLCWLLQLLELFQGARIEINGPGQVAL